MEIKAVAPRTATETAAQGTILLMERPWPALQGVDSSSGARGNATNKTVHELIDVLLAAPAEGSVLERQLIRLWKAIEKDSVDFLLEVRDRWGKPCRTPDRAPKLKPRTPGAASAGPRPASPACSRWAATRSIST